MSLQDRSTRARRRRGGKRRLLFALIALTSSSLFALICIEVALRVYEHVRHLDRGEIVEFCTSRHHRLRPDARMRHHSVEFDYWWINNSLGMRDRERSWTKAPGTYRILFLGDSMVVGHGVPLEEMASIRLEKLLNEPAAGPPVEVVNAGVFSYSPVLEYLYLEQIIGPLTPDLVVVGVTLENDIGDDHYYVEHADYDSEGRIAGFHDQTWPWSKIVAGLEGRPAEVPEAGGDSAPASPGLAHRLRSVVRHVRVARYLKHLWEGYRERSNYREQRQREFAFIRERLTDIDYNLALVNYRETDPAQREKYWKTSLDYLGRIVRSVREHGAACILVVIPPIERLTGATDFDEPYAILDDFGRTWSVPVIQLLPAFLRERPESVYYEYDHHWTSRGNEVAARVIRERLRELGIPSGTGDPAQ